MALTQAVEMRETLVTKDVICNKCGKSCRRHHNFHFVKLQVVWGDGSDKDQEAHRSHLCEKCYDELVATFTIPPDVRMCLDGDEGIIFSARADMNRLGRDETAEAESDVE